MNYHSRGILAFVKYMFRIVAPKYLKQQKEMLQSRMLDLKWLFSLRHYKS
jgi:hypothetical protein